VRMVPVEGAEAMCSVDSLEDLALADELMALDPIAATYLKSAR
jgi:hypothetical protein